MSTKNQSLTTAIIKRTLRVPLRHTMYEQNKSNTVARQLDVALIDVGLKASVTLLEHIGSLHLADAKEDAREILNAARELKGDHVEHNTYFKDFPENVPDTLEFWADLIVRTYGPSNIGAWDGDLLKLDGYGKYLHTYEEMLEAHEAFVENGTEKLTVLHLGGDLPEEALKLYYSLAESKVPANGDDLELLKELAEVCIEEEQPEKIPVRENKAVINSVRLADGQELLVDTVTDILRLAAYLSDGDVSLQEKVKFKSFNRSVRRQLVNSLDNIVRKSAAKLGDVYKHREQFKRLGERLHVYEFADYKYAHRVFETARDGSNNSFESKVEKAFTSGDNNKVVALLKKNPGLFVRSFNRLLLQSRLGDLNAIVISLEEVLPKVNTPVVVGLRQYLENRKEQKTNRIFINRKGTGKVVEDMQPVLGSVLVNPIIEILDKEVTSRLPEGIYIVDEDVLNVALPLSNKQTNDGFAVLPRGSIDTVRGHVLRFFTYWREKGNRTDYDLSALFLDKDLNLVDQVSFTNLRGQGVVSSGDITSAPHGASEFIDVEFSKLKDNIKYIVPQVNVYAGEGFDEIDESFFGYMSRDVEQMGKPFEAKTVKTKAEMRGKNRVALPLIFIKNEGIPGKSWTVKWLNASLKGHSWNNRVENNKLSTGTMVRAVIENEYLTVEYLVELLKKKDNTRILLPDSVETQFYLEEPAPSKDAKPKEVGQESVFYLAREVPEGLDKSVKTITLKNLHELL
jgi:stress response protein SCP2